MNIMWSGATDQMVVIPDVRMVMRNDLAVWVTWRRLSCAAESLLRMAH
jgi:hypothetical protein